MATHERLIAWQRAHGLTLAVYRETGEWPAEETYGLVAQARRAAVSCVANIAEGAAKGGTREFRRFLKISLGSLGELTCLLRLAHDLGYLPDAAWERLAALADETGKCTTGLHRSLIKPRSTT